jgi:hypothetical protein
MANTLYTLGRQAFLDGNIAWSSNTIKTALVAAAYTPNLATHQYLSDIGANIVGTAQTLASKTSTGGVADAADVTFTAVTGSVVNYVLIYKDTGSSSTSPLIALIDSAVNLPITPTGVDIAITWDNGTNKIFKL